MARVMPPATSPVSTAEMRRRIVTAESSFIATLLSLGYGAAQGYEYTWQRNGGAR